MHEYAHILHRDVVASAPAMCAHTTFSDSKEARAEATGMELLAEVRVRRKRFDVLDVLGGTTLQKPVKSSTRAMLRLMPPADPMLKDAVIELRAIRDSLDTSPEWLAA